MSLAILIVHVGTPRPCGEIGLESALLVPTSELSLLFPSLSGQVLHGASVAGPHWLDFCVPA